MRCAVEVRNSEKGMTLEKSKAKKAMYHSSNIIIVQINKEIAMCEKMIREIFTSERNR